MNAPLTWPQLLAALRTCTSDDVVIREGRATAPAHRVQSRPAASGSELCLFSAPAEPAVKRDALIAELETLAKGHGRRFGKPARVEIANSYWLVAGVRDEDVDGVPRSVIAARRPSLAYNPSEQTGDRTTLRSKRIKTT
jgi:hypothetical protein